MKYLAYLCKLSEQELKKEVYKELKKMEKKPYWRKDFIYAKGTIPILLVAHMDTVFENPPREVYYKKSEDKIFSFTGGIGADDRCGVYALLKILKKYNPSVLFTQGEEMGLIGAQSAVDILAKPNVKYIIEFDRMGSNDMVFYDCGNTQFMDYIKQFGFDKQFGTYSDISILGPIWDIASVNLSCGYYHEHSKREYVIFHELEHNIERVEKMLQDYEHVPYFDYQERFPLKEVYPLPGIDNTYSLYLDQIYGVTKDVTTKGNVYQKKKEIK